MNFCTLHPAWVFASQTQQQGSQFGISSGPTPFSRIYKGPFALDEIAMPMQQRFWLEQQGDSLQVIVSIITQRGEFMGQQGWDKFVSTGDFGFLRMLALHNPQLLAENKDFKIFMPLRTSATDIAGEQQGK